MIDWMNTVVLLAGGMGSRMGQDIPKQFIHVNNIPVIIYTMLAFSALQVALGWQIYFAKGSERNIKLTRTEDIDMFKAMLATERDEWLK